MRWKNDFPFLNEFHNKARELSLVIGATFDLDIEDMVIATKYFLDLVQDE